MTALDRLTLEALTLIENKVISGFNEEKDNFLNNVALYVKYYHNMEPHIRDFRNHMKLRFEEKFEKEIKCREHYKTGYFRWLYDFDDVEGNEYYFIEKEKGIGKAVKVLHSEILKNPRQGFYVAKDRAKILDFTIESGDEANFIVAVARKEFSKMIYSDGKMKPQKVEDARSHKIPLLVVKDKDYLVKDRDQFEEISNLKFLKGERCFQTLIKNENVPRIMKKIGQFTCEFQVIRETRLVTKEFYHAYL